MGRREAAREEAKFMRGDVGVDGAATEEKRDEAEVEQDKAREQLLRGRTWLGREFLTWLLWKSEPGEGVAEYEDAEIIPLFVGKLTLRGIHGEVTELSAKGAIAPYSDIIRYALTRGLLVHTARIRFTLGERVFEATIDAELLDVRSAKLPELLTEEEDDRLTERLDLAEQLSAILDALVQKFLSVRTTKAWSKTEVPALQAWMRGESREAGTTTALAARHGAGRAARAARA